MKEKLHTFKQKLIKIITKSKTAYLKNQVIKKRKLSENKLTYKEQPQLLVIVQFFNKKNNIDILIERLRISGADEIIIIDDGSIDGSYHKLIKILDSPNDFLLRCNDLFEVRTYDRAISMARGEYVCLLQDDDIPPNNSLWVEQAIRFFETFPKLLIIGGRNGLDLMMPDPNPIYPQCRIKISKNW
jgi:glycosyltransferase involved in cell wall biosynthesis